MTAPIRPKQSKMDRDDERMMAALKVRHRDTSKLPLSEQLQSERTQGGEYTDEQYGLDAQALHAGDALASNFQNIDQVGDNKIIGHAKRLVKALDALRASRAKTEGPVRP